jgi:hypothetical protein
MVACMREIMDNRACHGSAEDYGYGTEQEPGC